MSNDPRLTDLLDRWRDRVARGETPTPEELCRDCPELLDSLRQRLAELDSDPLTPPPVSHAPDDSIADTEVGHGPSSAATPARLGRFHLLRPHARGGMGEVFLARDSELNREVALKLMQDAYADHDDFRRRFVLEAEVTGRLEHPAVVPVYGVGADATGRPYYAMRFIRGESLHDAVRRYRHASGRSSLEFRQLLTRFMAVCDAVAYAHSRGVVHRDLKPANVMLGPYGETLVVDWGLARTVPRSDADREAGEETLLPSGDGWPDEREAIVGTPVFMAPEQAAGRAALVGPASDVYALGATLYVMLTGSAPIDQGPLEQTLEKARQGDFPPPRRRDPACPPALEAVCLKAMALKREDRYATATELASEVARFLAGEPPLAYREPFGERASRWARSNRVVVEAGVALLLVAVAALAVGLGVTRHQEQVARSERNRADENARLATANFRLAHGALRDTLQAINRDERLNQVDTLPARRRLLEVSLPYYEKFVAQSDDPELAYERAEGYTMLGDLRAILGEPGKALEDYRRTQTLLEELLAADPGRVQTLNDLAGTYFNQGKMLADLGRPGPAEAALREAFRRFEELIRQSPAEPKYLANLAACSYTLAQLVVRYGRGTEAEPHIQATIKAHREVTKRQPDPVSRMKLADALEMAGQWYRGTPKSKLGDELTREAKDIRSALVKDKPSDAAARSRLADSHNDVGLRLTRLGRLPDAKAALDTALALNAALLKEYPATPRYRDRQALYQFNLGKLYYSAQMLTEAEKELLAARTIGTILTNEFPDSSEYRLNLASYLTELGIVFEQTAQREEAEQVYRNAEGLLVKLAAMAPSDVNIRSELANSRMRLGGVHRATGRLEEAEAAQRAALADYQAAAVNNDERGRANVAVALNNLALTLRYRGKPSEAEKLMRLAVSSHEALARDYPATPAHRDNAAGSRLNLASDLDEDDRLAESERELRAVIIRLDRLVEEFKEQDHYVLQRGIALVNLSRNRWRSGRPEETFPLVDRIEKEIAPILKRQPNHSRAVELNVLAAINRARALDRLGRTADALRAFDEALKRDGEIGNEGTRLLRAETLVKVDPAGVVGEVAEILKSKKLDPIQLVLAAETCSLALAKLPAGDAADRAAALGLDAARRAWKGGAFLADNKRKKLRESADLSAIRSRADFKKLLAEIDANPKGS